MTATKRGVRGMRGAVVLLAGLACASVASADQPKPEEQLAMRLFERLTGVPLGLDDSRLGQMADLVKAGKLKDAAAIAEADDHFYNLTLKQWALTMSNKAESPMVEFNDFAAMIVGVARDNLDARTLLSGDFTYIGDPSLGLPEVDVFDNEHYKAMDVSTINLKTALKRQEPQREDIKDAAGLLTSRAWGEAHLKDGTNRRAIQYSFQEFLCAPIASWKDTSLPDKHVRRDVTRAPGNDPATYEGLCRGCHAPMDTMGGAYAHFDFQNEQLLYLGTAHVASKMNKNPQNYEAGWKTADDSWTNLLPQSQSAPILGWHGSTSGTGINAFGTMLSNADAFGACMTQRVFSSICKRDPAPTDKPALAQVSSDFASSGYKISSLFAGVSTLPACIGSLPAN